MFEAIGDCLGGLMVAFKSRKVEGERFAWVQWFGDNTEADYGSR
jgi:hypothetical protein